MRAPVPEAVEAASVPPWSAEVDVVVVGSGIAGGCAAMEAGRACASTIAQDGKGYSSGRQLASGSHFGRRAGRHAATG